MSVIGIDFGNDSSVVSIARRGGIDVVANEVSKRETPSIVSYGEKERSIGEAGLSIAISNFKNTITQFKRFIGLKFNSKEVQDELKLNSFKAREHKETGGVEFEVNYRDEVHYFTPEMVVATLLQKLKAFAELENGNVKIVDCVVSVPAYFTESQRRALLNATQIAGLNCLRLFNETTAAALNYGIFKQDFPEKEATHVCFVDVGQSATTISMVAFQQRQLKVLSHVFDRDLGARNLDYILADYFVEEIKKKYKMDVTTNPKALLRLRSSCEKVKKILSANSQASLNIECLMNDKDISFMIDRPAFEQLGQSLIPRFEDLVKKAYETSGLTSEKVSSVEVIGGGMRIPMIKEALEKAFGKKVVSTLNTSEAISRGCAIQGAMLSPNFRVKEFTVNDSLPFTINIGWKSASDSDAMDTDVSGISINKKVQMFKANDPFPSTKLLKFSRNEDFEIYAFYDSSENLTKDTDLLIGKFNLTKVPKKADTSLIKVKVKQNIHGLVQIESAQVVEETEVEVPATTPTPAAAAQPTTTPTQGEQAASPTAQPTEAAAAAPTTQKKVIKNHIDLVVNSTVSEMSSNGLRKALEEELQMQLQDRIVAETAERKNALESYIYDTRNKISDGGELFEYVSSSERDSLNELMNTNENWLYGDGYDSTKSAYQDRLTEMKKITDPALVRKTEEAVRSSVVDSLRQSLKNALNLSQSADEKYNHIEKSEKDSIANKCNEIENWLKNLETKQSSLPKHSQPVLFAADIKKKKIEIDEFSSKIMSKPKPKPPAPKPEEQKKPEEQQQQQNNQQPPQQPEQNNQTTTDQTKMDLD